MSYVCVRGFSNGPSGHLDVASRPRRTGPRSAGRPTKDDARMILPRSIVSWLNETDTTDGTMVMDPNDANGEWTKTEP